MDKYLPYNDVNICITLKFR